MDKIKVLNKQVISDLLKKGNLIKYETISGKVYVIDKEKNKIGAVRFDTFLKLKLKEIITKNYYSGVLYKIMEV